MLEELIRLFRLTVTLAWTQSNSATNLPSLTCFLRFGGKCDMWLDGCAVLVIAIAAWKGAAKGAVWQLAVLGSIAACIMIAGEATPHIEQEIPLEQPLKHWVALAAVYAGISLVVFLLARTIRGYLEKVKFTEYDQHWGAILGALKGAILVLCLTCLSLVLARSTHSVIRESVTGVVTNQAIQHVAPMLPEKLADALMNALDSSEKTELSLPFEEPFQIPD